MRPEAGVSERGGVFKEAAQISVGKMWMKGPREVPEFIYG